MLGTQSLPGTDQHYKFSRRVQLQLIGIHSVASSNLATTVAHSIHHSLHQSLHHPLRDPFSHFVSPELRQVIFPRATNSPTGAAETCLYID